MESNPRTCTRVSIKGAWQHASARQLLMPCTWKGQAARATVVKGREVTSGPVNNTDPAHQGHLEPRPVANRGVCSSATTTRSGLGKTRQRTNSRSKRDAMCAPSTSRSCGLQTQDSFVPCQVPPPPGTARRGMSVWIGTRLRGPLISDKSYAREPLKRAMPARPSRGTAKAARDAEKLGRVVLSSKYRT